MAIRSFKSGELNTIEIEHGKTGIDLTELWRYRELLYFLIWRDIKVKYKQTVLGIIWVILQPFITMVIFSILFGVLAKVPSDGIPYPIFVYAGLLPWTYFSSALNNSGNSLVANANLITKVYFPRLIIPSSASLAGLLDFFMASFVLAAMMVYYQFTPSMLGVLLIPALILLTFIVAVGCGLWLSALNVEYRDFQVLIPFLIQIWMFVTPVIYPLTLLPEKYRWLLVLNPMGGVIEAFRSVTLGHQPINWNLLIISAVIGVLIFFSGLLYFRKVERSFADVI